MNVVCASRKRYSARAIFTPGACPRKPSYFGYPRRYFEVSRYHELAIYLPGSALGSM